MIWTVLFTAIISYLITVISAAPNRSQRPECPDSQLMVYVNVTESDREEYHINRTEASTLLECTRKCHKDPRCFSLKYREVDALGCVLTDFSPESCLQITSVPVDKIKYDINTAITIDCIKCKLRKDLDTKELQISSESNDNDEPSPFADESLNDRSLQNKNHYDSRTDECKPSPMRCQEDIWFIVEEQSDSVSSDFFEETVKANSVRECAEKCFDDCCKIAVYSSVGKKCQLTKKSESKDGDNCETKPFSSYVNRYNESDWIKITCVTCGSSSLRSNRNALRTSVEDFSITERTIRLKERKTEKVEKVSESAEVTQTDNPEEPIITSALDTFTSLQDKRQLRLDPQFMKMTCVVVFEIDPQADKANFKAQDSVKVDRADHCAYLCYRDACTAAIFTPATAAGSKGTCERQFNIAEKCNSTLRREYYYKTTKPIYLQCFRCLSEKPQTKSPFDEITSETPLIPSKKHSFEITNVDQAEAGEELVKTTLVPDVELNTVEVESKETEKDFGTTAFDATNGNTKTSDVAEEIKNETEDASPVETSQTTPAAFAETGSETNEQPQAFTENAIDVTDDDSKTSTSTHTGTENTEMTTSESLIGSFISDTTFESNSATTEIESGTEIFGLMSSNDAAVEHENEFTKENKLVHAASSTIQAFDSVLQSTAESEEFNLLHESTTEASVHTDVLSSESESKIKSDGTGSTGVESTSGEAIETPAAVEDEKKTGTVVKDENSIEQFSSSTVMSGSMHAGNTEFKKDPEDDRNTIEAKSSDEQGASEGHTVSVHIDESTTASHGQDEATESSHFSAATNKASSKERTKNDPLSSKDVAEAFHTYLQGCIITFQADPHSKRPAESSTGFQASTIAKTAEVCAGRCYQDGCTGARYDPSSKECVLGYSGKHICNNGPEHFLYRANETIWIHCTGCKLYKPGDQDFNISIYSPKTKAAKNTEIKDTVVGDKTTLFTSEAQKVKSIETAEVAVTKSGVTSDESTPEAEKSLEHIMEGAVTETSISPSPPSSLPSSLAATEEEGISIEAMKISTTTEEEATIVVHTMEKKSEEELSDPISTTVERTEDSVSEDEASFTSVPLQSTLFGHDCTLLFQARPIDIHFKEPNSEMIPAGATSTVADCAKHCYMDGCVGAKFDPKNGECLLTFGDHHQCDENEQRYQSLEATEPFWIHCISCKKEFSESTLGLLTGDGTISPVTVDKSKEEEHLATDESFSTLEPTKIEEKFLTSVSQDLGLHSTKKIESEFAIDSDEIGSKPVDVIPESSANTVKANERILFTTSSSFASENISQTETTEQKIESAESGEEFGVTSTTATVEEERTSESSSTSTSLSSLESLEIETTSTATDDVEKFEGTSSADNLDTTILPEIFISRTLQTPLNVQDGKFSNGSIASSVFEESTRASKIESSEQKDQKEVTIEFQEEAEPTTISSDITVLPISSSEVTDDIVGVVASVVANISSNVEETDMQETAKMSEESTTENQEIVSSVTSESTISTNVKEIPETAVTSSITGETPSMELDAEVTSEEVGIANPITAEEVSEIISATEETSTPMKSEKNTEVTSGISEITFDEALFSKSAPNSITEQPFVQANVDDVIRQVAQSKDILVTDTKPPISDVTVEEEAIGQVKGEGEGATQVDEDLSNIVDTLVSGSEHMTTEPPVQAVSDLISVLSQNSKVEEVIGRKDNENDAFIVNDMSVTKDGNDQATTDIVLSQLQEGFNKNSLQNIIKIKPSEGRTGECLGRIEFEILEADLSQLNVTNEIIVESPAACARKCYETANCILAAYKPSQNDESTTSAVCMLTSNAADCTPQEKFIPQHKSDLSPLIISCLKCTKCNYTIREETKLTRLHQAEIVEPALSIGQCSEICWKHSCTFAQYDHRSNLCSLTSVKGEEDCSKEKPVIVDGDEPVLLECVRCFT